MDSLGKLKCHGRLLPSRAAAHGPCCGGVMGPNGDVSMDACSGEPLSSDVVPPPHSVQVARHRAYTRQARYEDR